MTDPSAPTKSALTEIPYSEWSLKNNYDDPLESYSRYTDDVKDQYLKAGEFNIDVGQALDSNLISVLEEKGLITQENQDQVFDKLNSYRSSSLEEDIEFVKEFSNSNQPFSGQEENDLATLISSASQGVELPEGMDADKIFENVRSKKEDIVTALYDKGTIDAGAYIDSNGERKFLGGRIPEGKSLEDVILDNKRYGVVAEDILNIQNKRKRVAGTSRLGYTPESDNYNLMQYEVEDRLKASGILKELITEDNDLFDKDVAARFEALRRDYGKTKSWDMWDSAIDNTGDVIGDVAQSIKKGWNWLSLDDEEFQQVKEEQEFEELMESHEDSIDEAKEGLLDYLKNKTGYSRDVLEDAVDDTVKMLSRGKHNGEAATLLYSEDGEDLSDNVVKTSFNGVLVAQELNFKPEEYKRALYQAGLTNEEVEFQEANRIATNELNFSNISNVLANDEDLGDQWQEALIAGKWKGLSNNEITEKFVEEHNPSLRYDGLATSVKHGVTTLGYGIAAMFNSEWGQDGLVNNQKEIAQNRAMAEIFGVEMGMGQDAAEQLAPMAVDMMIGIGATLLTPVTGGLSAVGAATYASSKAAATSMARRLIKTTTLSTIKSAPAAAVKEAIKETAKVGVTRATIAKTFYQGTFSNVLKQQSKRDLSGKLVKEEAEDAVERILKAKTLGADATADQVMGAVKMYNGRVAKFLDVTTPAFIPAATRSGSMSYGSMFSTTTDQLTAKHQDAEGNWIGDWSADKVRQEAHDVAFTGALVAGTTTGLITAGLGQIAGGKFGGVENAYLRGVSYKQLKIATDRMIGRTSSDVAFQKLIKRSVRKVMRKAAAGGGAQFLRGVAGESFEEGLDELLNGVIQDTFTNQNTPFRERIEAALHGAALGAFMGGLAPAMGAAIRNNPLTKGPLADRDKMQQLEAEIMDDFDAEVAKDAELVQKRKELEELAPATAKELEKAQTEFAEKPATETAPQSEEEAQAESQQQEAATDQFADDLAADEAEAAAEAEEDARAEAEVDEMEKALKGLTPEGRIEFDRELDIGLKESIEAYRKKFLTSSNDSADGNLSPDAPKGHPHHVKQVDPKKVYQSALVGINKKEKLFRQFEETLRSIDTDSVRYRRIEEEFNLAIKNRRALSPKNADRLRTKAKSAFEAALNPKKEKVVVTEGDTKELDKLIELGYPVSFLKEHLSELGLRLERTDNDYLKGVADVLKKKIRSRFPVRNVKLKKGRVKIPSSFAKKGSVYVDANQQGVFNNDPEGMLTLLQNGFFIPVPAQYAMQDSGLNPAFNLKETYEGSGSYYVSDIRVPHAGGTYSALVRFNEIKSLLPDWSRLKDTLTELDVATTTQQTLMPNVVVDSPFTRSEFNNRKRVTLEALLMEVSNLDTIKAVLNLEEDSNLPADYANSAAIELSNRLKLGIWNFSKKIEDGEAADVPFNLFKLKNEVKSYYQEQYNLREQNSREAMVALMGSSENLSPEVQESIEEEIATKSDRLPNYTSSIPDLNREHIHSYIKKQTFQGVEALKNDGALKRDVASFVNKHKYNNTGADQVRNLTESQLFSSFTQLLSKRKIYGDSEFTNFIKNDLESGYPEGFYLNRSIRLLGLGFGTSHININQDPEFQEDVRRELQKVIGKPLTLTKDQTIGFFNDLSESVSFHMPHDLKDKVSRRDALKKNAKEILDMGLEGNNPESVIEVLQKIADGSLKKYKPLKEVAKLLLLDKSFIREVDFSILSNASDYAGLFYIDSRGVANVEINPSRMGGRGVGETLVHEYVHAFTVAMLERPAAARTKDQNEAIATIQRLQRLVIKKAQENGDYDEFIKDGTLNTKEFVAYLLTSTEFQKRVRGYVPAPKGSRGGLYGFFNAIVKLFGGRKEAIKDQVQEAMDLALDLTGRGLREPATEAGFRNQVADRVMDVRSELNAMAGDKDVSDINDERLNKAANDYTAWARGYVPEEINLIVDPLAEEVVGIDENTGSIIFNPKRAAIKLSQLVSDQNIDPNRRTHILASMINEQIGNAAAIQMVSDEQLAEIAGAMTKSDLESAIEDNLPLDQQADSFDKINSSDPRVAAAERARIATKVMVNHASKALKGETTNQQIAFLASNPTLIPSFINYLKVLVTKLTYRKSISDTSPEMKNGVNNIIREIRAMEMGYAPAPSSITHNPRNPEEVVNILLKQGISSNTLAPEGDLNDVTPEESEPTINAQKASSSEDSSEDTFADDSLIPESLRVTGRMPEGKIGNWLDLLDVPLMELHDYDIPTENDKGFNFKKALVKMFKRRADRRVVSFYNQNKAFIRETKGILEDFQNKFDATLEAEEARISESLGREYKFSQELFAAASGSNVGSQLTEEQTDLVQGEYLYALKQAESMTGREKKLAVDLAEKAKSELIMQLRNDNRSEQIARRDRALETLMRTSPALFQIVTDMRKLQDQLSKKAMDVFEGTMDPDDLKISFDFNKGIYLTRRYRMFEDNNFARKLSDLDDDTYHEQREKAAVYFARQEAISRLDDIMRETGLNRIDARQKIEDDLANKDSKMMSDGRRLVQDFINSYSKSEVRNNLQIKNGAAGPQIVMPDGGFDSGVLSKLIGDIKDKNNIPEPIRELLGEYKEDQGIRNLSATMLHTATSLSNQAFFNKLKELGTKSDTPWLVNAQQYAADQTMPVDRQKYSDWVKIKNDTGDADLTPIKGMYVPKEVHSNLKSLFADEKDIIDEKDQHAVVRSAAENFAKKATGYSLAMKTLGSVGFYFRNMIGNALYFGPMQGYYGGNILLAKEVGGIGSAALQKVGLMEGGKLAEESLMVRAAKGSRAELDFELIELKTMDVFGDELEVSAIQELLNGSKKFEDIKRESDSVSSMVNKIDKAKSVLSENDKLGLASLGIRGVKNGKEAHDKLLALGGKLASAADGFFKIGLYEFELGVLKKAAQEEIDNNNPTGDYAKLLDDKGNATPAMKMKAAEIVKDTAQSYSRAVPLVKDFNKSTLSLVLAPYVRFAADVPRVYANGVARVYQEMGSDNEVIRKRGRKRLRGLILTTAGALATTKGTAAVLFGLFESEDEESALRAMLPDWAKGNSLSIFKDENGIFYTVDLTYLNPFAIIQDPIFRSMENIIGGKGVIETMTTLLGPSEGLLKPYAKSQILAGAIGRYVLNEDEYGNPIALDGEGLAGEWKRFYDTVADAFIPRTGSAIADSYRIMNGDKVDKMFEGSAWGPLFKEVLPIKPYQLDLDKGMKRFMSRHKAAYTQNKRRVDNLLTDEGSVPLQKIADTYDDMVKLSKKQNADYYQVVNGFLGLGIPKADIERQAKAKGFGPLQLKMNKVGMMMRVSLNKGAVDRANKSPEGRKRVKFLQEHIRVNHPDKRIRIN